MVDDIIDDNVDDGMISDDDIMTDWKKEGEGEGEEEEDISDSDLFREDSSAKNIPQRALSLLKHIKYFNDHKSQSQSESENEKEKEDAEANKMKNRKEGDNNDENENENVDENENENEHIIEYEYNNKHVNERCWTSDERYSVTEVSDFNTIDDLSIEY